MEIFLETERMLLRECTADDVDRLVELHNDPDVMRYLGPCEETAEHVRDEVLPRWQRLYVRNFGYWAAIEKAARPPAVEAHPGLFLGWFLFRPPTVDPEPGVVELGYRLHVAAWGRGFATEGAIALVDKGFRETDVQRVVADTMTVNKGSQRVMQKAGLRFVRTFHYPHTNPIDGSEHGDVEYAITREEWSAGPSAATPPR